MDTVSLWKRHLGKVAVYYVGYRDDTLDGGAGSR